MIVTESNRREAAVQISKEDMEATRVARWGAVKPYGEAFVENRIPGHEKNLYKIINRGVLENKGAQPAIQGEHRFGISMIEVPPGSGAGLHSHVTEEVFCPLNGRMIVIFGDEGEYAIELNPWDVISVPPGVMRGFRNPNAESLVIYSVVGGNDTEVGRITWHPEVLDKARETGLLRDDSGYIISDNGSTATATHQSAGT
jgi:mannose-6-phosphate isomerase-like protein (cupin superfamily)